VGQYLDTETGMYHMGARYYDPTIARFTQQDPQAGQLSSPLSLNRYLYVGDNPVNGRDCSGRSCSSGLYAWAATTGVFEIVLAVGVLIFFPEATLLLNPYLVAMGFIWAGSTIFAAWSAPRPLPRIMYQQTLIALVIAGAGFLMKPPHVEVRFGFGFYTTVVVTVLLLIIGLRKMITDGRYDRRLLPMFLAMLVGGFGLALVIAGVPWGLPVIGLGVGMVMIALRLLVGIQSAEGDSSRSHSPPHSMKVRAVLVLVVGLFCVLAYVSAHLLNRQAQLIAFVGLALIAVVLSLIYARNKGTLS
jgi:RHS repeat-associated protein